MTDNSAFEGIQGAVPVQDVKAGTRLKLAIVGKPKTGKSWLAATVPGKTLHYDFDERYESLDTLPQEFKENIFVKTLADASQTNPTTFKALEQDINLFKYKKSEGKSIPDNFILDSATFLKKAIENEYFSGGGSTRSLKVSSSLTLLRGKDWDTVNTVIGAMEYFITEFSALGNLIVVFHERPEKDKVASTEKITKYTDKLTVDPQFMAPLLSRFNEVWRIDLDYQMNYVVTCKPTDNFLGSTTLLIDKEEKPNITEILAKHRKNVLEQNK